MMIVFVLLADRMGVFVGIDTYLYDLSFRIRGVIPHNRDIVLISIDEKTLNSLGRWPLSRKYYARLIEKLDEAKAVGLNLIFSEPSDDDAYLDSAIAKNGKVVLPLYIERDFKISKPYNFTHVKSGHIHVVIDYDGLVRRVFHTLVFRNKQYESFPSALYETITNDGHFSSERTDAGVSNAGPFKIEQMHPMLINFYGPPGVYERISLSEALKDTFPAEYFRNKIVIIGVTAPGIENTILTPFTGGHGVITSSELYATILNNLLDKNQIIAVSEPVRWIALLLGSVIAFLLFGALSPKATSIFFSSCIVLLIVLTFTLFKSQNIWIKPAALLVSVLVMFLWAYMEKLEYARESLKRAKLDWEDAFATLNDTIIIQDEKGVIVRVNKPAQDISSEPLLKRLEENYRALLAESRRPNQDKDSEDSVSRKGLIDKDLYLPESDTHLEIKSLPRLQPDSRFRGVVHVISDVTERMITEEERRKLESQLIQAQKMEAIGTLAGGIAHDFNNILSAIIGYTELGLLEVPRTSRIKSYLEQTFEAGKRAGELVKQILAFSRQTDVEIQQIRVASIIKETIKLLRSTLPSTIEIRQYIENTPMVMGDPTQIHQIVMNLCTNAYHAMQENGGVLTVTLRYREFVTALDLPVADMRPAKYVELIISDTGHGIPPENLNRIFDPYYTTKKRGKGTGLGLAVVHGIVKSYHGAVTVESQLDSGTIFRVFLPAIDSDEQTLLADDGALPRGNERILLVDDESPLIDVERQLLERLGYSVTTQTKSREALRLFGKEPMNYDLVITDLTMPELTGDNLARELLKVRADIPIVLCTGFSEHLTEEKARALGIKEFVTKPLLMKDFALAVRRALMSNAHPPNERV